MIAKCKAISHSGNAISYAMNKDKAEELYRNGVAGDTSREINQEFEMFQNANTRCKNNTLRIEISPTAEDRVSKEDMRDILQEHLKELKLDKHQCIAYVHYDTKTPHIHAIVNRIDREGKAFDDKYISNRFSRTADKIAQERGLTRANELRNDRSIDKSIQREFEKAHEKAIEKVNPRNFEEYQKAMKTQGYNIEQALSRKTGRVSGIRIGRVGEKAHKISGVSRKVGTTLTKNLGKNLMRATPLGQSLSIVSRVTRTISQGISLDRGDDLSY